MKKIVLNFDKFPLRRNIKTETEKQNRDISDEIVDVTKDEISRNVECFRC